MSVDPYIDVKREVESNLASLHALLPTYTQLSTSSPSSPSFLEARDELRGTLSLLEADLADLDESVRIVEERGERWGIDEAEVRKRRGFVERVRGEVRGLRKKVMRGPESPKGKGVDRRPYRDLPDDGRGDEEEDDREEAKRWEMEEQQMLVQRQDDTLGAISGTLHTLASQAGLIGGEVAEQSEMLDDLGNRVDTTDSRLGKVRRTLDDFIRRNEETKSGWCMGILIVVLIILLLLVIIT